MGGGGGANSKIYGICTTTETDLFRRDFQTLKTSDIKPAFGKYPLITFDRKVITAYIKSPQFKYVNFHKLTCIFTIYGYITN